MCFWPSANDADVQVVVSQVEHMLGKYEWIASEKQFFGQPNTAYDFSANDMDIGRKLTKLEETKDRLAKNVNMRAMNMLGKAEEKVNTGSFSSIFSFSSSSFLPSSFFFSRAEKLLWLWP